MGSTREDLSDGLREMLDFAGSRRTHEEIAEFLSGRVFRFLVDLSPTAQAELIESWGWERHTALDTEMQVWTYKPPVPSDEGGDRAG